MKLVSRFIAFPLIYSYNLNDTLNRKDLPCMEELDVFAKLEEASAITQYGEIFGDDSEKAKQIAAHKAWLQFIRRERPSPAFPYKVGIYIRYYNQTKYDNYLEFHKKSFLDTLELVPNWEFVGFYIDEGMTAPNMETAPEWSRLLEDCFDGKVDLIITQKISNVSKKIPEITWCARLLAAQENPVGIYFISEDVFTLASYYMQDLRDVAFLPEGIEFNNRLEQEYPSGTYPRRERCCPHREGDPCPPRHY